MGGALLLVSAPEFWLGLIVLFLFADDIGKFKIFPGAGSYTPLTSDPWKWFTSMLLPWFVLAASGAAVYARLMRGSLIETMNEDFIRTARAKGLPERKVVKQGVRASINPIVTLLGVEIGVLLGGAVLIETVFNIPGVGRLELHLDRQLGLRGDRGNGPARGDVHHRREHRRRHRVRLPRSQGALLVSADEPLLTVEDLKVDFPGEDGVVHAVDGISYEVMHGQDARHRRRVRARARPSPR